MSPLPFSSSSSNGGNTVSNAYQHECDYEKTAKPEEPVSLEGVLQMRKGKSLFWHKRYVVLNLEEGCLKVYNKSNNAPLARSSKLHRRMSLHAQDEGEEDNVPMILLLPASLPWTVKDIAKDPSCFVIEIDTTNSRTSRQQEAAQEEEHSPFGSDSDSEDGGSSEEEEEEEEDNCGSLWKDIEKARRKGRPLRFYVRCLKGGNEKVLWLKAFSRMSRLSAGLEKKILLGTLKSKTKVRMTNSRRRSASSAAFVRESKHFDITATTTTNTNNTPSTTTASLHNSMPQLGSLHLNLAAGNRDKEHKVLPEALYSNVWMTQAELNEEMERPSETFHDLEYNQSRLDLPNNPCKQPIVGNFQIECLQGLGFPKLDRYSQTDAVVYIVSGPYAFCTDVIKNKANPMWLAKTQRACNIPLHHAYARVYIGVFDDEKTERDDFNGRIVLDLSRLRPNSTYDVTLPLRLSTHIYSRRRRGALRLRFRLQWHNPRAALLSYLPNQLPRPRFCKPNTDTVVACGSARAFRNVAITVHGAHLPGKFSFTLLRATLRELNFTRKQVMTIFRQTIKELREWDNPLLSCFVFCAWMHCIYDNSCSLVPAYLVSFFLLHLARNYARYGMDGPAQRGFIPPSWEELLWGLLQDPIKEGNLPPIEPLDMGYQTELMDDHQKVIRYNFETHQPQGKALFRKMGFLEEDDNAVVEDEAGVHHLEFPFADGTVYPKFGVADSLVVNNKKKARKKRSLKGSLSASNHQSQSPQGDERHFLEMPQMLRKDASGLYDYDDEEQRFATGKFLRQSGATSLRGAASLAANGLIDVGGGLTEVTGLQYVVSPIKDGLQHYVVPPIKSGIKSGYRQVAPPIKSGIKTSINGINHVAIQPIQHTVESIRRSSTELWPAHATGDDSDSDLDHELDAEADALQQHHEAFEEEDPTGAILFSEWGGEDEYPLTSPAGDTTTTTTPAVPVPDQDIDFAGVASNDKNRKRLTDDLVEIKDKFHELTLHSFNDSAYVVKDSNSRYFGGHNQLQRPFKRRKVGVSRNLDKLLEIGPYSHKNPIVSRVGQYVEPIVGASQSFLCAFRALFNVMTWRDPMLTFWLSIAGLILVVILFAFPWRLFLFVLGLWFVGPHNWAIRILRKRGVLPPKRPGSKPETTAEDLTVPEEQIVFKGHISQDQKRKSQKAVDPREVQYVVVPYSPLMYQRFYDWPPEEDYAQVRSDQHQSRMASGSITPRSGSSFGTTTTTTSLDSSSEGGTVLFPTTENSLFSAGIAPISLSDKKKDQ